MISKFAQFEYSCGDMERGRTLFENALSTYPKRTDIWSMYIDTLIKARKLEEARYLFLCYWRWIKGITFLGLGINRWYKFAVVRTDIVAQKTS